MNIKKYKFLPKKINTLKNFENQFNYELEESMNIVAHFYKNYGTPFDILTRLTKKRKYITPQEEQLLNYFNKKIQDSIILTSLYNKFVGRTKLHQNHNLKYLII